MSVFSPCSEELFFKSTRAQDPRLGEFVNKNSDGLKTFVLAGYPDDEGIALNGGRVGASQAPDLIRRFFYKMTPASLPLHFQLRDHGNLKKEATIADRHLSVKNTVSQTCNETTTWVGLGGGHDYAYPDGAGFLLSLKNSSLKPLIINFDAHFDVRPDDQGFNSGTGFYRLLTDKALPKFDFVQIGIQKHCNSSFHRTWLEDKETLILNLEDHQTDFAETTFAKLSHLLIQPRPTYLSIDIDAFSNAYAPGCSQAWSTGLVPNDFMRLLKILKKRLDIRCLGIYEVSPPLDLDFKTSKLAAQIIYEFIYAS